MPGSAISANQPSPIACRVRPDTISGRSPIRSAMAPATGATVMNVAVHGSSRSPAPSGPWSTAVCRNWAKKNTPVNSEAKVRKIAALPAEKARERNSPIGSIGSRARSSQATNATTSAAPATSVPTTSTEPQPAWLPRTSPQTSPSAPPETRASPARSRAASEPKLSFILVEHQGYGDQPDRHVEPEDPLPADALDHAPPTSGPLATARPVIALKMPIAAPRFSGGNAALSRASPSGMISAAPAPCRARATISDSTFGASAQAADEAVNTASPTAYSLRRP